MERLKQIIETLNTREAYFFYAYFVRRLSHVVAVADWEPLLADAEKATKEYREELAAEAAEG